MQRPSSSIQATFHFALDTHATHIAQRIHEVLGNAID